MNKIGEEHTANERIQQSETGEDVPWFGGECGEEEAEEATGETEELEVDSVVRESIEHARG